MKKLRIFIITLVAFFVTIGVARATWQSGDVITSIWLNTMERELGISNATSGAPSAIAATTTLGSIRNLATTTGNIIVATGTGAGGWTIKGVGSDNQVLSASSTAANGLAWINQAVVGVTTSTFVATAPIFYNADTATFSLGFTIVSSTRAINTTAPLFGGGDLSADRTLTLGIDAVSSTRAINTGFALAGGGDLSADRTLYFAGTFSTSTSGTRFTISSSTGTWTFNMPSATSTASGTLSSADWTRFDNGLLKNFTLTVPAPTTTAADFITNHVTMKHFDSAFTINKVSCVNVGSSSNVSFQMRHSTTRSDGGGATALFSAAQDCTNTTSSIEFTTFNDNALAADEMLWTDFTAASSSQVSFTIFGRFD